MPCLIIQESAYSSKFLVPFQIPIGAVCHLLFCDFFSFLFDPLPMSYWSLDPTSLRFFPSPFSCYAQAFLPSYHTMDSPPGSTRSIGNLCHPRLHSFDWAGSNPLPLPLVRSPSPFPLFSPLPRQPGIVPLGVWRTISPFFALPPPKKRGPLPAHFDGPPPKFLSP